MAYSIDSAGLAKLHDLNVELKDRQDVLAAMGGPDALAKSLNSSKENGIMAASHQSRADKFGTNTFPEPAVKTFVELCLEALEDTCLIILCVAAAMSLLIGIIKGWPNPLSEMYEGLAILSAVVIVTLVTAINELKKEQQFQDLNRQKEITYSNVIRGGASRRELTSELLVGDVVELRTGDKIPADGIMFQGDSARADEASLTGEAETVRKTTDGNAFLYSGCLLAEGDAKMFVTSVGPKSQWGIIKEHLSERDQEDTPLQEKLEEVAELIGKVGLGVAIACFVVLTISWIAAGNYKYKELVEEGSWKALLDFLVIAVTIVAVAVPEGLPLAVTISLAYSMSKMMEEQNLVRHLQACETMGSATMICSDKTGTLTQNKMTVVEGYMCGNAFQVDNGVPTIDNPISPEALSLYHAAAKWNSSARVTVDPATGAPKANGNATECALLNLSSALGRNISDSDDVSKKDRVPFSSVDKHSAVIIKTGEGRHVLVVTGAPERVVEKAVNVFNNNGAPTPLNLKQFSDDQLGMARKGLRTVSICIKYISDEEAQTKVVDMKISGLTVLCTLGLKDPVRPEVPGAVAKCQNAGITVRMVTGDNPETATFIAQECGILTDADKAAGKFVMTGPEFAKLSDEALKGMVVNLRVLARSSPSDKLRLVKTLKELNEVVAVTGDGTNDAPALKEANVGLAMNIAGTEVAKDASDIVILDDNFSSIVAAVKWGRSVFDNIRKFIQFQLTINFVALILAFFSAVWCAFAPPEETELTKSSFDTDKCTPLNAIQLLWINLIMDSMGALALATEEPEDSLLERKPTGKTEGLISPIMWRNIAVQGVYQLIVLFGILFKGDLLFNADGYNLPKGEAYLQSRPHYTLLFNAFVWCQIFNEFNSRRLDNEPSAFRGVLKSKIFVAVIVVTIMVQYAFVEYGGEYTKTVPLKQSDWLATVAIGSVTIPIGFLTRLLAGGMEPPKKESKKNA